MAHRNLDLVWLGIAVLGDSWNYLFFTPIILIHHASYLVTCGSAQDVPNPGAAAVEAGQRDRLSRGPALTGPRRACLL